MKCKLKCLGHCYFYLLCHSIEKQRNDHVAGVDTHMQPYWMESMQLSSAIYQEDVYRGYFVLFLHKDIVVYAYKKSIAFNLVKLSVCVLIEFDDNQLFFCSLSTYSVVFCFTSHFSSHSPLILLFFTVVVYVVFNKLIGSHCVCMCVVH